MYILVYNGSVTIHIFSHTGILLKLCFHKYSELHVDDVAVISSKQKQTLSKLPVEKFVEIDL